MSDILYLSVKPEVPSSGYWDQTLIHDLVIDLPQTDRQVIIIPGAYQGDVIPEINKELAKFPKVLVFVTSDEECKFNIKALEHPDMIVYSQYGNEGINFPIGYTPHTRELLKEKRLAKDINWFFAGQVTHYRRQVMAKILKNIGGGMLHESKGFAQGLSTEIYMECINRAKVVLCPPGPISQDSFRLYEALEAGCVPIVDDVSPIKSEGERYVFKMFSDSPFPIFSDFADFPDLLGHAIKNTYLNSFVYAWWINCKYRLKNILKQELGVAQNDTTVIIPVSPIPSHPSTRILEETIKSVRHHTKAPILLLIDGVRPEQEYMTEQYQEFIRNILWKCNFEYTDVLPVLFPKHYHQSGMVKLALDKIVSPYVLFVEHDTPLVTDEYIDWIGIKKFIQSGGSNCVRFHFETFIPEEHKYLMIGEPLGDMQATKQWSQRPHIASTAFYRSIMAMFSENSNCFIEDFIHGQLQDGDWDKWRVHIYHPEGSIKRSLNLDGRAGGEKFDKEQIW